jgi:hypothetical protein
MPALERAPFGTVGTTHDGEGNAAALEDALDLGHEAVTGKAAQQHGDVVGCERRLERREFPVRRRGHAAEQVIHPRPQRFGFIDVAPCPSLG